MKVVFLWHTFEGHFAACWRALCARGVAVHIIALQPDPLSLAPYSAGVLAGLDYQLLTPDEMRNPRRLLQLLRAQKPDVIVIPGWVNPAAIRAVVHQDLAHIPLVMAVDTPYRGTWRQRLGRLRHRRYFRRVSRVVVAGQRALQLAQTLGFADETIDRGMYGIDDAPLRPLLQARLALPGGWPRRFLFVGRYIPAKAIDVLAAAYLQYRAGVTDPWELVCCGRGPMQNRIAAAGARDLGFVQPHDMRQHWLEAGALLLPSRFEPWGQVIVEAAAAGLPIVCSDASGAGPELVRDQANGRIVPADSVPELVQAMFWLHNNVGNLAEIGKKSREFALTYSAEMWAERWAKTLELASR